MHAMTDSEETSFGESSPSRSPQQPVYYVESPSGDSHYGEKTSMSSTTVLSPMESPGRTSTAYRSSSGCRSPTSGRRSSTGSRMRVSLKTGASRVPSNETADNCTSGKRDNLWTRSTIPTIEEEGLLEEEEDQENGSRRNCYFLLFLLCILLLFSLLSLILWGAARPQKPTITMKSISFQSFYLQAGSDASGVPTIMSSVNSTLMLVYRNTATFFGVHVSSSPFTLCYSEMSVATGCIKNFYQRRRSERTLSVPLQGDRVPLYGAASAFTTSGQPDHNIPVNLSFVVRSKAFVLGRLVRPRFSIDVQCSVVMDPTKLGTSVSLHSSCQLLN
ncbi:hypothetical protein EJ110_NYTH31445 [Nymphaea thermarum]|nr:hypothetical protein EJ110_NYTH31445 [Nymphaea thermarum]